MGWLEEIPRGWRCLFKHSPLLSESRASSGQVVPHDLVKRAGGGGVRGSPRQKFKGNLSRETLLGVLP